MYFNVKNDLPAYYERICTNMVLNEMQSHSSGGTTKPTKELVGFVFAYTLR
jgi:hypothetical protein